MRMPLLVYFVVMSFVLTAALIVVSNYMAAAPTGIATSQIEGLRKPFIPEQEPSPYLVTGTNFAAPREVPTEALARVDEEIKPSPRMTTPKKRVDDNKQVRAATRPAESPISVMMAIH